ncbi:MAG: cobalt transporter subunit [Rhodospirillaceae bacterium]|nr:cobalt transporter subunit [Rhodospirillaceae bacterium]
MSDNVLKASIAAQSVAERAIPVMILAMLGVFLLYGVGFAQPDVLHNAAHDGRHSFAFPCH